MLEDRRSPSLAQVRSQVLELCRSKNSSQAFDVLFEAGYAVVDQPGLWELLARGCLGNGDLETAALACTALEQAGLLYGDLAVAHASYLVSKGEAAAAAALLTSLFGAAPTVVAARQALLKALLESDPERALHLLNDVGDGGLELALVRADAHRSLNQIDEAAAVLRETADRFPADIRITTRQARLEERRGNWAQAIAYWSLILERYPSQGAAAQMKIMQLQTRFEHMDSAATTAASFVWPRTPVVAVPDLLERIEILSALAQSHAVREAIVSAATVENRHRHADDTWVKVANWLIDAGQIGLAAWLVNQGIPVGDEAGALIATAQAIFGPQRRDMRSAAKASAVISPDFLLPQLRAHSIAAEAGVATDSKILLVNATLAAGGAERQFVLLIKALLKAGVEAGRIEVALFSTAKERGHSHFQPSLEALGVRLFNLGTSATDFAHLQPTVRKWLALMPRRLRSDVLPLIELCMAERPAVIHGWQDRSAIAVGLAGVMTGVQKIVLTARNMQPDRRFLAEGGSYRRIYAMLCGLPNVQMTVNSEAGARDYETWIGLPEGTLDVMHNGVDVSAFPILPTAKWTVTDRPVVRILGVFRLAANKRPELWMRTVSALRARGRVEVEPRIVGSGPFLSEIEALRDELGLQDLRIEKHLSTAEAIYGGADILLLMSRVEGTPNVVIEAQCCGLSVAACDVGGVREALGQGNLVMPHDIEPSEAARLIEEWIFSIRESERDDRIMMVRNKYDMATLARSTLRVYGFGDGRVVE